MKKETIREAIIKNRGGWENATDSQLATMWSHLSADTQKGYLESIKKEESNATSTRTKPDVSGDTGS